MRRAVEASENGTRSGVQECVDFYIVHGIGSNTAEARGGFVACVHCTWHFSDEGYDAVYHVTLLLGP